MASGMIVEGARVYRHHTFHDDTLYVLGDRFVDRDTFARAEVHAGPAEMPLHLDASGLIAFPTLIDSHVHGGLGVDVGGSMTGFDRWLIHLARSGVGAVVPTTISAPYATLSATVTALAAYRAPAVASAEVLGLHLEGPCLAQEAAGFHPRSALRDFDNDLLTLATSSHVVLMTVAPERLSLRDIARLADVTTVALGHSRASYELARAAFAAGASRLTHAFNAMAYHHRDPGLLGAALDNEAVTIELIADGHHVHPSALRALFQLAPERLVLVSDALFVQGLNDGSHRWRDTTLSLSHGRVTTSDGHLAGGATTLYDALAYVVAQGVPLTDALYATTEGPAKALHIDQDLGVLAPGRRASFVLATDMLTRVGVILNGQPVTAIDLACCPRSF